MVKDLMNKSPIPIPIQYVMLCVGLVISIVAGISMLRGKAWARLLYVAWSSIGFVTSLATSPVKLPLLPGIVVFGVMVFFLYRPRANEFFSSTLATHDGKGI
jgi:hypothetical protein